ncbi:MAG: 16S rRNA (cytidine(1402)-2'-O)-methyltransferase [Saprospiraceae bacterium]|nr:16S rRNA (cytidine(1402)-2'-O)-methyltransferase [Saprospiraceae bacterium]
MLYIVPTPIGNLEDMTIRAINVLKEVNVVYAEDTRTSQRLFKHYSIETPLRSFHSFNEHKVVKNIVDEIKAGRKIALVSDAGTPAISDPGFLLSRACREAEVRVICLPGATAFVPALVSSGLPCDKFHFEGFLPHKKGRQTRWKFLSTLDETFLLYESPHRLLKCLEEATEFCGGNRQASVARELSKVFEEVKSGNLNQLIDYYKTDGVVKGEIVVVIAGKDPELKKKKNKYSDQEEE